MTQDQRLKLTQAIGTIEGLLVDLEELATTIEDILND